MGDLTALLLDVVNRAVESDVVEGPASRLEDRQARASSEIVVLADCSGSMADLIGVGGRSKYRQLQIALEEVWRTWPGLKLVAFAEEPKTVARPEALPPPIGTATNLARALRFAAQWEPRRTIVISDGLPTDERGLDGGDAANIAAGEMTGAIDTIYCGPESDTQAIKFLRGLSVRTGGKSATWDGWRELGAVIRGLLPAPGDDGPGS